MKRVLTFISFLLLIGLISGNSNAQAKRIVIECPVSLRSAVIKNKEHTFGKLTVNKPDTVSITIPDCWTPTCKMEVESENMDITPIGNNLFILKPKSSGRQVITVYTVCPPNTFWKINGNKMPIDGSLRVGDIVLEIEGNE